MVGAIDGASIWWVGPTFTITSIIWRLLKRATYKAWTDKNETEKRIELPGGGSVTVHSADNPDSLRGEGLDGLVVDEAAFIERAAWTEALSPALMDRQGWCMMITTPHGYNWIKEEFDAIPRWPDAERWQRPSSDNPLVTAAWLERELERIGPRAFQQECEAQFCDVEGAEFPGSYFGESIWVDEWGPLDGYAWRAIGLDPSKGKTDKADYSAFAMVAMGFDGRITVDMDMERRDVAQILSDGVRLAKSFQPHAVGVESNQFQEVLAIDYQRVCREASYVLPLYLIDNRLNKRQRIRATLTPYLSRGDMRFVRSRGTRMLVQQLRDFPSGDYDDGPDALEMGVRMLRQLFESGGPQPRNREIYLEQRVTT